MWQVSCAFLVLLSVEHSLQGKYDWALIGERDPHEIHVRSVRDTQFQLAPRTHEDWHDEDVEGEHELSDDVGRSKRETEADDGPHARHSRRAKGGKKPDGYSYPPRHPLPLQKCFHNPTGYVCCNTHLNDLMVETYTELEAQPKFHTCNLQAVANALQYGAQRKFNQSFEALTGMEDFAQKIHFDGDRVCKVEVGGKYMLSYGTSIPGKKKLRDRFGRDVQGPLNRQKRNVIWI